MTIKTGRDVVNRRNRHIIEVLAECIEDAAITRTVELRVGTFHVPVNEFEKGANADWQIVDYYSTTGSISFSLKERYGPRQAQVLMSEDGIIRNVNINDESDGEPVGI